MGRAVAVEQMQSRSLLTLGDGFAVLRTMAANWAYVGLHTGGAQWGCCRALRHVRVVAHACLPPPHECAACAHTTGNVKLQGHRGLVSDTSSWDC